MFSKKSDGEDIEKGMLTVEDEEDGGGGGGGCVGSSYECDNLSKVL